MSRSEYVVPSQSAETIRASNEHIVLQQSVVNLANLITQAFPMLQPSVQDIMRHAAAEAQQVMANYNLNLLNGGGERFISLYNSAINAHEMDELVARLPVPAVTPFSLSELKEELSYMVGTMGGDFIADVPVRGSLYELIETLNAGPASLELSGVYTTPDTPQAPAVKQLISLYRMPGSKLVDRMLVLSTVNGTPVVEFKIYLETERRWVDDNELRYFTTKDLVRAIADHPHLNANVHERQLQRGSLASSLRRLMIAGGITELDSVGRPGDETIKLVDDQIVVEPVDAGDIYTPLTLDGMIRELSAQLDLICDEKASAPAPNPTPADIGPGPVDAVDNEDPSL